MKTKFTIKDIALIAIFSAIIFIQEEVLMVLPNVQLTVFLMILFAKKLGFVKSAIIVIIHTTLDNLYMGSFSFIFSPFMYLGWLLIPILVCTIFRKVNSPFGLAIVAVIQAVLYCGIMIIPTAYSFNIELKTYILSDIPFTIMLAASSFLSTLFLYLPCSVALDALYKKPVEKEQMHNERRSLKIDKRVGILRK